MIKRPATDDLHIAAQWLAVYEGEGEDAEACERVRAWLLDQADAAEFRAVCRAVGVPVGQARKAVVRMS
jgi:hypothetical protein